jgi:hypothetical protein
MFRFMLGLHLVKHAFNGLVLQCDRDGNCNQPPVFFVGRSKRHYFALEWGLMQSPDHTCPPRPHVRQACFTSAILPQQGQTL